MKALYAAYRHDPLNPNLASSADYNFYNAIKANNFDVEILGPFLNPAAEFERGFRRIYRTITRKKYAKFPMTLVWQASQALNRMERISNPDVIFTIFPPSLVFYTGQTPCVYRLDTCFKGWQEQYPTFGTLALRLLVWQEKRAFRNCAAIVTHSHWTKNILTNQYGLDPERIKVFANPSALPIQVVPKNLDLKKIKRFETPYKILLVGRNYNRKGIDIAIEVINQLNARNMPAELTVCGVEGEAMPHVKFVGFYKKSDPDQLRQYIALYRNTHLLLHPARFDPSPIVTSEAAAFGVPTITNDVGGIATSVKDGESGIVLPKNSPSEAYVQAIVDLLNDPERYYALCATTRERYERELNWDVAGKKVAKILQEVVNERRRPSSGVRPKPLVKSP